MTENNRLTFKNKMWNGVEVYEMRNSIPTVYGIHRLGEYEDVGTIEEFKALKEKAEPKKLNSAVEEDGKIGGYCPNCNGTVLIQKTFLRTSKGKCCDWCGQKLDWQ